MLNRFQSRLSRAALGISLATAVASAAAIAQQADQLMPQPGEVRLSLKMGDRTVAFPAKSAVLARETVPFEVGGHAITAEGRAAMTRLQEALFRQPSGSLVLVVYGEDEQLAYQRAKAVRGELAERHSMDAARIIASGRKADGHQGDLAVVDVYGADPTRCGGCNGATFRTIALDSATMRLVTMLPEALPQSPSPAAARPAAAPPTLLAPAQRIEAARPKSPPVAPTAPAAPQARTAERQELKQPVSGCPKPRIIIDDYYPGGPMVPCRITR